MKVMISEVLYNVRLIKLLIVDVKSRGTIE